MPLEDELEKLLDAHAKKVAIEAHVIGTAINITDGTCDVEVEGEATLLDVRLHCIEDELKRKFVVKPKEKSLVIVGIIHNLKTERFIVQCSQIDEVVVKIDTVEFNINSTGVLIKNGEDTLKKTMDDLFEQLKVLTVPCTAPGTPSGTPTNAVAFALIKERINKLLR